MAVTPTAPLPVQVLTIITTGGAALLCDLDTPSSTAAHSLGLLTRVLARGIGAASSATYHATRTSEDSASAEGGHRYATHTVPASLAFGLLASLASLAHPAAAASLVGLLAGLMHLGSPEVKAAWRRLSRWLGCGRLVARYGFAAAAAGLAWWVATSADAGWLLWLGVPVFLGCLIHIAGDALTNSGVPCLWPLVVDGERWHRVHTPATFKTGGVEEQVLVTPCLLLCLALAASWETGLLSLIVSAATSSGRGA